MPPCSHSHAFPPSSPCTEAIRHLSIRCQNEQLHSVTREPSPGAGPPLTEKTGRKKEVLLPCPHGPGSHCDRQQFLSPEHFSICHLTANLHDKNTSIFGTSRILVLTCKSTDESMRERTVYFNNNYYYRPIIINLFNFYILCTRQMDLKLWTKIPQCTRT